MINAKELRYKNLFIVKGIHDYIAIHAIDVPLNRVSISHMGTHDWIPIDDLQPIPLTPEVLEKCGFDKHTKNTNGATIEWLQHYNLRYLTFNAFLLELGDDISLGHIIHLHQLQNLYMALTGEELEVNL
jgi:hypothetical protein